MATDQNEAVKQTPQPKILDDQGFPLIAEEHLPFSLDALNDRHAYPRLSGDLQDALAGAQELTHGLFDLG